MNAVILDDDIVFEILKHCNSIDMYTRYSRVCKLWRHVSIEERCRNYITKTIILNYNCMHKSDKFTTYFPSICLQVSIRGSKLTSLDIKGITNIHVLDISDCSYINDLTPLITAVNLRVLIMQRCRLINDLTPITKMSLDKLDITGCGQLTDLTPLHSVFLYTLDLIVYSNIQMINSISKLNVNTLGIQSIDLSDLTPIRTITGLHTLDISYCSYITDLTPLSGLPLKSLNINNCWRITDLTPLSNMPLNYLYISYCLSIKSLLPLKGMPLHTLDMSFCDKITTDAINIINEMPLNTLDISNTMLEPERTRLKHIKTFIYNYSHN